MEKLCNIFDIVYGNQFDLNKMSVNCDSNINFVSRGATNLGVVAKVDNYNNKEPFPAGCITVALGGSVLSSFVQMNELKDGGFYIINLDTSNNNGTHWTALYFHPLQSYYCDSFG